MSAAELAVRLLLSLLFLLAGVGVLLPVLSDRRGLAAVVVLVAVGTTALVVTVRWPGDSSEDRKDGS